MERNVLYFTAPKQVELRRETLPALGAADVLVQTLVSAVSAGTEMLVYHGRFPRGLQADSAIDALRGPLVFPLAYGYASVGRVVETGSAVDRQWLDRVVFSFQPHASHFICTTDSLIAVPEGLSPEAACFLPNMETAVNFVHDGAPLLGERALVLGQGVVGLLTASLLAEFPLEALVTTDRYPLRRAASPAARPPSPVTSHPSPATRHSSPVPRHPSPAFRPSSLDPQAADFHERAKALLSGGADLTYELTGQPEALNDAIALTSFSGRVVIGSWYGEKRAPLDLGGAFHRSRLRLVASQVSTIAPELSGRWDKARRFDTSWQALDRIQPEKWVTHRFPFENASAAYRLLDESPHDTIQITFNHTTP